MTFTCIVHPNLDGSARCLDCARFADALAEITKPEPEDPWRSAWD